MRRFLLLRSAIALAAVVAVLCSPVHAQEAADAPFTAGITDAASLRAVVEGRIGRARQLLDRMLAVTGARTVANTLAPYDDLMGELFTASAIARNYAAVHPDDAVRKQAEALNRDANALMAELALRPDVYAALAAIDLREADADTRYLVTRELRDFRLGGVDKPAHTRARLEALRVELTEAMDAFARNQRDGVRKFTVAAAELDGLPADFIARHAPDADGLLTLTTENVDLRPLMMYARNADVRKRALTESYKVAYPENIEVLTRILRLRAEIAALLGFRTWADYDMASRMAGEVGTVSAFIDRIVAASEAKAQREYDQLLREKRKDHPGEPLFLWDRQYYAEQVRRASYAFDSQGVRPYFPFDRVLAGVLDVTSRVFGVSYTPASTVAVWHPSVRVYEVRDGAKMLGRVYLDLHPRANKNSGGAYVTTVRYGKAGQSLPEAVLVASLPGGQAGEPGLMTHDDVRTLFHEFGHVIHRLSGGHQQWQRLSSIPLERDFTEGPSQMFEEWVSDPKTLATFARHYQTGEPIPERLVLQMRRASEFGLGLDVRGQMVLARVSLAYHQADPGTIDMTAMYKEIHNRYMPIPYIEGTHRQTAFPHIGQAGYASAYYAYMWSLVIAKDLFSTFEGKNLVAPGVGRRYREIVFTPGSTRPAADLVRAYLGRPFNTEAWERWLNQETAPVEK
jgi:thimet oligopeptidase